MNRRQRREEKARLLRQIKQQRIDVVAERRVWLDKTASYDRYWLRIMAWRHYWLLASGAAALYGARHPNRLIRWARRGIGLLGTLKLLHKTLSPR
ncbi:MAG: YqjK-like family protein [Symbiopectobacterium sp.]|uniref:YqjK-like family protein n=1 Tax=Symbiopectobacterium sp. TaxID=2952789 RepID=UPI0039E87067